VSEADDSPTSVDIASYQSPEKNREKLRKDMVQEKSSKVLFTFETKPFWKFQFLCDDSTCSTDFLISQWEVPADYTPSDLKSRRALPESWSPEKKKVFHLIRQVYGQMVSSKRKYGVIHLYEVWWFCRRTPEGHLKISRPVKRGSTSPSVLQVIVSMAGVDDHFMAEGEMHSSSARKAKVDCKPSGAGQKNVVAANNSSKGGTKRPPPSSGSDRSSGSCAKKVADLASCVYLWDCELVDSTDHIKLFTTKMDPSVLVKMQRNPVAHHVATEMHREAEIYEVLSTKEDLQCAIPSFRGYSTHLGVPLLCLGMEGSDFEDIGIENLSEELKLSAVESLWRLARCGLLHHDIALRNIVQTKGDPQSAKIIDFGRAEFSDDEMLLQKQVQDLKAILFLPDNCIDNLKT
jgi:predicted Ser/Thr protein kinase